MAFSLASHSIFAPRPSSPSAPAPAPAPRPCKTLLSKPLALRPLPLHHPRLLKPFLRFPLSPVPLARRFDASLAAAEDSSPIINDDEEDGEQNDTSSSEDEAAETKESGIDSVIKAYKEAIQEGNEKSIAEIEALIKSIENENKDLVLKVSALSAEISSAKEKYLRLQADFDNFRKRSQKERLSIRTDAQGEVIESLLPMVDNFERAKQQIKPETDREKQIDTSYQGIYKQFVEIMRSLHVSTVATVGKPFDPALHEAIQREGSEEFEEGIVSQEFRRGFLLGERLLRPAMVKVSAGPGPKKTAKTVGMETPSGQPVEASSSLDEVPTEAEETLAAGLDGAEAAGLNEVAGVGVDDAAAAGVDGR